jgi:hypothetical protein
MQSPSSVSKAFEQEVEDVDSVTPSDPPIEQVSDAKEINETVAPVKRDRKGSRAANLPCEVIDQ